MHIIWKICTLDYLICEPKTILNCNISIAISTPANYLKFSAYIRLQPRYEGRGIAFTFSLRGVRGFSPVILSFSLIKSRCYFYLMKRKDRGWGQSPWIIICAWPFYIRKNTCFLWRRHYNIWHFHSFAEEDRGLDLQDPSSCTSAHVDCVIT